MLIECDMSRFPRSRGAPCGVLFGGNEVDDGRAKRSINRTHGSTLAIVAHLWIYTPRSGM